MAKRTENNFKGIIESRIGDLAKAETTAHEMLALLSRDLLVYIPDSGDIEMLNRLLNACKTRNRDYAILFFKEHLPWNVEANKEGVEFFTTKSKNKAVVDKHYQRIALFLKEETNTIWTWIKENVRPPQLTRNFVSSIASAVDNALHSEKSVVEETITKADGTRETIQRKPTIKDIILAVQAGGISIVDIVEMADAMKSEAEKAEAERVALAAQAETEKAAQKAAAPAKRGRKPANRPAQGQQQAAA